MIRLKTTLDYELWCMEHQGTFDRNTVGKRIREALEMLDSAYGSNRTAHDMGGYVFLFTSEESFDSEIERIMDYYHLDRDLAEYSEVIEGQEHGTGEAVWWEELYLLSSDDAILMIHPQSTAGGQMTEKKGA